jgi:ABC-type molybdenum transport system ATPase subunit/photorepair protein PhrA
MPLAAPAAADAGTPPPSDAPVLVFDGVSLAFDDKVILREIAFTVRRGHTKIILGASGSAPTSGWCSRRARCSTR